MSEYSPPGRKVKMTKAQMRKYLADMEAAQELAQAKLDAARISGELDQDSKDLERLEDALDEL
ncbi:hypothetical protein OAN96_01355 [Candidatus Gracilibacteria bacterium]|nr:hypothetical protein [Candidatus Gracilibacteria bacterium]